MQIALSRDDESMKNKVERKTQNEKIIKTNMDIYGTKHMKKKLLESGRNSVM